MPDQCENAPFPPNFLWLRKSYSNIIKNLRVQYEIKYNEIVPQHPDLVLDLIESYKNHCNYLCN